MGGWGGGWGGRGGLGSPLGAPKHRGTHQAMKEGPSPQGVLDHMSSLSHQEPGAYLRPLQHQEPGRRSTLKLTEGGEVGSRVSYGGIIEEKKSAARQHARSQLMSIDRCSHIRWPMCASPTHTSSGALAELERFVEHGSLLV